MIMKKGIWLLISILFILSIFAHKIASADFNLGPIKAIEQAKEKLKDKMRQEGYNPEDASLLYAPINLTTQVISDTKIKLSWEDKSVNEDGFIIERRTGTSTWKEIGRVGKNIQSFEDNTVSVGITYYYRVRAYNKWGAICSDEAGISYTLTVYSAHGTPEPSVGIHSYSSGTEITASVSSPVEEAGIRYICTGWTGSGSVPPSGTGTTVTFIITQNSSITWNWEIESYYLTLSVNPSEGGNITPSSGWYGKDTSVTITATPNSGYIFSHWSGDISGTNTTGTIPMDGPKSVTANFVSFTLSMPWHVVNAGGGKRSSSNYGLKDSFGQLAVGRLTNSIKHQVGFITGAQ
jgi:hypothetical protein